MEEVWESGSHMGLERGVGWGVSTHLLECFMGGTGGAPGGVLGGCFEWMGIGSRWSLVSSSVAILAF